jgi:PEGA domain
MKRAWTLIAAALIFTNPLWAADEGAEIPEWTSQTPIEEGYYFAVGVAEAESEVEARKNADKDAVAILFESVFGVHYTSQAKIKKNPEKEEISVNSRIDIGVEFLDQIEHLSAYAKKQENRKFVAYQLVRINKQLADKRKKESEAFSKKLKPGHLAITSDPIDADVSLDDVGHGVTPTTLTLVPGKYRLRISKTGFKPMTKMIDIRRAGRLLIDAQLEKATGTLVVSCLPVEAKIKIDGAKKSCNGGFSSELSTGSHEMVVEAESFETFKKKILIGSDETQEINVVLKKSKAPKETAEDGQDKWEDTIAENSPGFERKNLSSIDRQAMELIIQEKWGELAQLARSKRKDEWFERKSRYFEAKALYHMGLVDDSIEILTDLVKYEGKAEEYCLLCQALYRKQDLTGAEKNCNKAILLYPENGMFMLAKARLVYLKYYSRGNYNDSAAIQDVVDTYYIASKKSKQGKLEYLRMCKYYNRCRK